MKALYENAEARNACMTPAEAILRSCGPIPTLCTGERLRSERKPKKLFIFDVETGGLDHRHSPILELAYVLRHPKGRIEGVLQMKPFPGDMICLEALEVNKLTISRIKKFLDPEYAFKKLVDTLDSVICRYDAQDKAYPVAYNGHFDYDFLRSFFKKCGNEFAGSYFNNKVIDPLALLRYIDYKDGLNLSSYKLTEVCRHFAIPLENAHTALGDVLALEKLLDIVDQHLTWKE